MNLGEAPGAFSAYDHRGQAQRPDEFLAAAQLVDGVRPAAQDVVELLLGRQVRRVEVFLDALDSLIQGIHSDTSSSWRTAKAFNDSLIEYPFLSRGKTARDNSSLSIGFATSCERPRANPQARFWIGCSQPWTGMQVEPPRRTT